MRNPEAAQDAVRGDHGEVAQLLEREGGRIYKSSEKRLVELAKSHVAGCAARLRQGPSAGSVAPSRSDCHCSQCGTWRGGGLAATPTTACAVSLMLS